MSEQMNGRDIRIEQQMEGSDGADPSNPPSNTIPTTLPETVPKKKLPVGWTITDWASI